MQYEASLAVQRRSIASGRSDAVYRSGDFWLDKRRDGRSDCWMIAWYSAKARTVCYRSTRTLNLEDAKDALARFTLTGHSIAVSPLRHKRAPAKVYFIGGDVGGIKIGTAADPALRLPTLQCGSPIPLRIFAVAAGGVSVERAYHAQFAAHRLHGEWFERAPEILAEIARINEAAQVVA